MRAGIHSPLARIALLLMMLLTAGLAARREALAGVAGDARACAALGTYAIGPYPLPMAGHSGNARSGVPTAYPGPVGALIGTVRLDVYGPCGGQTGGSFSVHAIAGAVGPQPERGQAQTGRVIVTPLAFGTRVLTATGTIAADPLHPSDPSFVSVSGTVSYGRYRTACAVACAPAGAGAIACPESGCGAASLVVTRVSRFTAVTGYLRLRAGDPWQLALAFLPPPDMDTGSAAAMQVQPLSLSGRRSG